MSMMVLIYERTDAFQDLEPMTSECDVFDYHPRASRRTMRLPFQGGEKRAQHNCEEGGATLHYNYNVTFTGLIVRDESRRVGQIEATVEDRD